jgi:hypothetical protein
MSNLVEYCVQFKPVDLFVLGGDEYACHPDQM